MSRRPKPQTARQTARQIREAEERKHWWSSVTRDLVLFVAGLALLVNEVFFHHGQPRESLLVIYAGMIGLPAILRADEMRRRNGKGK